MFKRLIIRQMYNYLNTNNLTYEQQYGFRSGDSLELATIKLINTIIQNMDNSRIPKTQVALF